MVRNQSEIPRAPTAASLHFPLNRHRLISPFSHRNLSNLIFSTNPKPVCAKCGALIAHVKSHQAPRQPHCPIHASSVHVTSQPNFLSFNLPLLLPSPSAPSRIPPSVLLPFDHLALLALGCYLFSSAGSSARPNSSCSSAAL